MATTTTLPRQTDPRPTMRSSPRLDRAVDWLARYSVDILRISLGVVFLAFGAVKFVPDASPAQALVERTLDTLSLGLVSGEAALLMTAVAECFIGITLVTGKLLRAGLAVLGASLVGIMSPLVLGPQNASGEPGARSWTISSMAVPSPEPVPACSTFTPAGRSPLACAVPAIEPETCRPNNVREST